MDFNKGELGQRPGPCDTRFVLAHRQIRYRRLCMWPKAWARLVDAWARVMLLGLAPVGCWIAVGKRTVAAWPSQATLHTGNVYPATCEDGLKLCTKTRYRSRCPSR